MKRIRFLLLPACLLAAACAPAEPSAEEPPAPDAEARASAVLAPLKQKLMAELTSAVADGAENAIQVCRIKAQEIPAELSAKGLEVGRTSHRLRNPDNAPEMWMVPLLSSYADNPEDRAPRMVEIDSETLGYVEPIYVNAMCLVCHGSELSPEVQARLGELYPGDEAAGFEAGEFRGMFWVKMPVEDTGD